MRVCRRASRGITHHLSCPKAYYCTKHEDKCGLNPANFKCSKCGKSGFGNTESNWKWLEISDYNDEFAMMYANQKSFVDMC